MIMHICRNVSLAAVTICLAGANSANADIISILDLENWKTAGILRPGKEPDGMGFSPLSVAAGSQ